MKSRSRPARSRKTVRRRPTWLTLVVAGLVAGGLVVGAIALDRYRGRSEPTAPDRQGCTTGPTVPGIDVSYHQEAIDWRRVRQAGVRFAFIRVSDGLTVEDPRFGPNWDGAHRARILRGAYQFFRPEVSATAQADLLIAAIRRDPGELPPVIDVEATGGRTPAQLEAAIRTWVERVRTRLGVEPIVYVSPRFWRDRVGGADLSSQPLWIAHYRDACPEVPAPWTRWTFWQYSETGTVPGIRGKADLNVFAGTLDELRGLRTRGR